MGVVQLPGIRSENQCPPFRNRRQKAARAIPGRRKKASSHAGSRPFSSFVPLHYASNLRKATEVLWPPKPKALLTATSTVRSSGSLNV